MRPTLYEQHESLSFRMAALMVRAKFMNVHALIVLVFLSLAACTTVELQGDFTAGRQALLRNDSSAALGYFEKVARANPKYTSDTVVVSESIWTYVGRAYYNTG